MEIINGKKISQNLQVDLQQKISSLPGRKPGLAFLLIGDNPASVTYVRRKKSACSFVGIRSFDIELPESTSEKNLLWEIEQLNQDNQVDGILVQLPLPKHLDERIILAKIDPNKDVDGFHPLNVGKMLLGDLGGFLPCTPLGIHLLLQRSSIPVEGKHVVILGRSNIVGKPLAAILMQKAPGCNATVTVAHSATEKLVAISRSADIVVAAIGKPRWVGADMISPGTVVVDVGINSIKEKGRTILVGDVDFEAVAPLTSHITPVPGGVGPMTIAALLQNTYQSFLKRSSIQ